ncbi:MAG: flagella basal body P-ring formation protein FlgA, partial [Acidobacteriaceae bacterium]
GLHRQWAVLRDCAHPARPARLVEVPWSDQEARSRARTSEGAASQPGISGAHPRLAQPVRPGMRVTMWRRENDAAVQLSGTALEAGRIGDRVLVRAGLHGATLHGVVRGPALVELLPGSGGNR